MPATYEALSQGGHEAMTTEIFTKIKSYLDTHGVDSKVSKSGDTMTGDLYFDTKEIKLLHTDVDALESDNDISSNIYRYVAFYDKNDNYTGWYGNDVYTDGRIRTELGARNYTSDGSNVDNTLTLTAYKDGTRSVTVSDPSIWRTAINAVNKSGDTMTGKLTVSGAAVQVNNSQFTIFNDAVDLTKSNNGISENVGRYFRFLDKNNKYSGMVTNTIKTDGEVTTVLTCRNYKTDGNYISNSVSLSVAKNGTRSVSVSDPAVWRTALGLDTMATQNTGSYYTKTNINDKIPSGVVIRTGTVVRTLTGPSGTSFKIFTQSQLNSLTGKTNRGQSNTAVLLSDGDITAHTGKMTYQCFTGNDYTATFSAAYSDQLFRFNYIIASW